MLAPDDACCAAGQVCSFQQCETPGAACNDATDCAAGEYCELSLGDPVEDGEGGEGGACQGGQSAGGKCLPRPPLCAEGEGVGDPPSCLTECQTQPPTASFDPVLKYAWGGVIAPPYNTDVMMSPIVLQLDDDDCDGTITERDIPEIIFSTFTSGAYTSAGVVRAISIVGGEVVEKWDTPGLIKATGQLAGGNVDGEPGNEIIGCGSDGTVYALNGSDGSVRWQSPALTCLMPSIADLDQDGSAEVIVEGAILDGTDGSIKHAFEQPLNGALVVSDITGDGKLEVVTASQAFDDAGDLLVSTGVATTSSFYGTVDWKSAWPAVADLDGDGSPEVIVAHNQDHALSIWRYDASADGSWVQVRAPFDLNLDLDPTDCPASNWGRTHGGGPPTVADFNGDGTPDVALAGGVGYVVFDGTKLMDPATAGIDTKLWTRVTTDCSSASTGSTVFDFNGDGVAEVVYSDELYLRIYDGPTGDVLAEICNTTATLIENPAVADVDNDGQADIVAVSNAYGRTCDDGNANRQAGVRVFGAPGGDWVRTRRVWNQHAYHVTNVNEDGSIPAVEVANYTAPGLNNFRQNKQPGNELSAPDAVVTVKPSCGGVYGLVGTVRNLGEAALPAGVEVSFYMDSPPSGTLLGTATTTKPLYSAEAQTLLLSLPDAPPGVQNGTTFVYAVVSVPVVPECRTDNNTSEPAAAACGQVK